jgi:transcription initiation factor TFIIB
MSDQDEILWEIMTDFCELSLNKDKKQKYVICKCGSNRTIKEDSIYTCKDCYAILDNVIDTGAEWRYYGEGDNRASKSGDPSRCGMPTNDLLPKSSLGTIVGKGSRDTKELHCVRKLQSWTIMPYDERKLIAVFEKYKNNTANEGISKKVIHDANIFYKQVSSKKISRGDNSDGLIASCMYYSCILNKVPRSMKEIADIFDISISVLTKGNARFQLLMPMNFDATGPEDFISRFGSQLNMSKTDIEKSIKFAKFLDKNEITNDNSPTSTAAGIISYYCNYVNLQISKKYIANICAVSDVTISKALKNINKYEGVVKEYLDSII